jgi:hypothetical protein
MSGAKNCNGCQVKLVFRTGKSTKDTNMKCNGNCFDCDGKKKLYIFHKKIEEIKRQDEIEAQLKEGIDYVDILANENIKVYLNVSYDNKEEAKAMGARWDTVKKRWYAPSNTIIYADLIKKYSSQ